MTDIGSTLSQERQGLQQGLRGEIAQPGRQQTPLRESPSAPAKSKPAAQHKHSLWESLTASLELACRGYLCMQIVDCDPVNDPECSAAGTKVVVREIPGLQGTSPNHD